MPERDPTTGRFISDTAANTRAVRELNAQLSETISRMDSLGQSIPTQQVDQFDEGLLVATAALVGMNAAVQDLVRSQIDAAVSLERQQLSLETISGSVEAATQHYKDLLEVARLPGINISQALQASAQLQAIGLSGQKTAEAIGAIGNALALSGQSAQQLTPIVSGFRQLNAEGKILQEDLAIITTRIPSLIPLMRDAFGGTRAEDVRRYYESIGEASRQTELFSDKLVEMLRTLPTMSDTAGNALENLEDTAQRLQARIGTHLLPSVKSAATGLEDVLRAIENNQGATRSIAVFTSMASTLLGVTSGAAALRGALRLLVPVLPLFAGPWGIAAAAVGALAAAFVGWKVATSEAKDEIVNLNTFIARNTDLIKSNTAAVESGALAEIRASRDKIRAARGAAEARVKQLEETAKAQFDELRGIKRSGEAFEELSGSLRRTNANLEKAEGELQRLNTTLRETNAEAERLENFETAVGSLKSAIAELNADIAKSQLTIGDLSGGGIDIRTPQSNLQKVADVIVSDLETYNAIAEAARGGDEQALQNLVTLQEALRDASQEYFDVLQQGLAEASTVNQYQEILRLADAYQDAFGNVDFLRDFTAAFNDLGLQAIFAIDELEEGLKATQAAIDELKRLEKLEFDSPLDATKFNRRLKAAGRYLAEFYRNQEAEDKKRAQSQRANMRLGEQLDKNATKIFKDAAEERTKAVDDETKDQIKAREQGADAAEGAADRVTKRWLDGIDEREKAESAARKRREREEDRARRRREREEEREAERRKKQLQGLAVDLTDIFEQEFNLDFLSEGLQAAFGDPIPFAKKWAQGFIAGMKDIFDGEQLTPFQQEIQGKAVTDLARAQLEQALDNNLAQQEKLLASYSENILQNTEVWEGLIASEQSLRTQLENLTTSLIDQVAASIPGFGQEWLHPLLDEIRRGLIDLGLDDAARFEIIDRLPESSRSELEALNQAIQNRLDLDAPDETLAPLLRIADNTGETATNTRASEVNARSVLALMQSSVEDVKRLVAAQEDTPLQNWLDTRQGIIRLFAAEAQAAVAVGQKNLLDLQVEQIRQQRRASDPDFAFLDDLRLLLEVAEVPEKERLAFLKEISEALTSDFTDQSSQAALIASIVEIFDKYQILPETRDAFTTRFAELLPVWQDISISTAAAAEYLSELREYLKSAGVSEDRIHALVGEFKDAFSDNTVDFYENQRLLEEINTTLKASGQAPLAAAAFADSFTTGFDILLPVWQDIQISSAEAAQYLKDLREYLLAQGVPEERVDEIIGQFQDAFADNVINFEEYQRLFDNLNKTLDELGSELPDDLSIPFGGVPEGTSVPFGGVPEGTDVDFGGVPEGTDVPFGGVPEGTDVDFGGVPEGTDVPFGGVPEGTDIDFGGVPEGTSVPFGGVPEGTDVDFGGVPEGTSVPFGGVPEGVTIPIDVSGIGGAGAGGGSEGTPIPPISEDSSISGLAGGSAVPSPGEVRLLEELALLREIGEADGQHAVAIKDALLNGITINNELRVTTGANGLETSVLAVHTPVDLSADAKRAMGLAAANTRIQGGRVSIEGTAQVRGRMAIEGTAQVRGNMVATIANPVQLVDGALVRIDPNQTQQVEIVNLDQFVTALDNLRSQIQQLGG